jgi:hypothetical protein
VIINGRALYRLPLRRRHTRRELERMNTGLAESRDRAVTALRQARDHSPAAALLEQIAAGYDEDAAHLDRLKGGVSRDRDGLNAAQRRAVADELRNCARDIERRP